MANNYALKFCPFCGGGAIVENNSFKHSWTARCTEGCVTMPAAMDEYFSSKEKAIEAWNQRVGVK